jgi:hypothetical protein
LFPLLHHKAERSSIVDEHKGMVYARCWSKGLGEPVLIRYGRQELVDQDAGAVEAHSGAARRVRTHIAGDLGGAVDTLVDLVFQDFECGDQ